MEKLVSDDEMLNGMLDELENGPLVTDGSSQNDSTKEIELMQTEDTDAPGSSEGGECGTKASRSKVTEFPLSKIKGIMKMDPEVGLVGSEAVFVAAKAAELFLQTLASQAYKRTQSQKKKVIQRSHLDAAINESVSLFFLEDALD